MSKKFTVLAAFLGLYLFAGTCFAGQSTIIVGEGVACMGDDKSRKQTQSAAVAEAKRNAVERTLTYVTSETKVKDFVLEKDLVNAYSRASVKVLEILQKSWERDPAAGDCFRVRIQAEIVPDPNAMKSARKFDTRLEDPSTSLVVKVWTNKKDYKKGDKIKVYLKGNKPFFARVVYKNASGNLVQLLPNIHRSQDYFNGGTVYEIPSGHDTFKLEVTPPFGPENIIVYASTKTLGRIDMGDVGGVYAINTSLDDLTVKTRGVAIKTTSGEQDATAEFFEAQARLTTSHY